MKKSTNEIANRKIVNRKLSNAIANRKSKNRKSAITALLTSSLLLLTCSQAAVPVRWTVEVGRVSPVVFEAYHGETLALEASFKDGSKALEMPFNGCCLMWQTNGMGSAWWQAPAAVSTNRVTATFTPAMDPGAAAVTGFLGATGQNYRAAFTLRFRHGPGAAPNALEPPVRTLDFASVAVANAADAPFALKGQGGGGCDTNATSAIITNHVASGYLCTVGTAGTLVTNATDALRADVASAAITNAGAVAAATASAAAALAQAVGTVGTLVTNATQQTLKTFKYWPQVEKPENVGEYMVYVGYGQTANVNAPDGLKPGKTYQISRPYTNQYVATEANFLKELATENWTEYYYAKKSRKINGKPLSGDITLTATDVGAHPNNVDYIKITNDTEELSVELKIKANEDPYISYDWTSLESAGGATWRFPTNSGRLALRDDVASPAITNEGAVAAAAASAAATYLPKSGGRSIHLKNDYPYGLLITAGSTFISESPHLEYKPFSFIMAERYENDDDYLHEIESELKPDGSAVVTEKMMSKAIGKMNYQPWTNTVAYAVGQGVTREVVEDGVTNVYVHICLAATGPGAFETNHWANLGTQPLQTIAAETTALKATKADAANTYTKAQADAASTNASAAVFAANADYALTGGAVLKSGEIAAIETATNLTVTLDFAANGRGADCGAYVENTAASNVTLAVAGDFHVACAGDEPLTLPKASTNIVYFCRVKTNVVVVSRSEIK